MAESCQTANPPMMAISADDAKQYGCPHCGQRSSFESVSRGDAAVRECAECQRSFIVLAEGLARSPIGIDVGEETVYPELQDHPRRGTPAHGTPDTQPEGGGEFFASRGIGTDVTPGCFVCGGEHTYRNNIAAFVRAKAAGERVVAMFERGAWLDYRESEPDYVQIKVGACDQHLPCLRQLHQLTRDAQGIIRAEMIAEATSMTG